MITQHWQQHHALQTRCACKWCVTRLIDKGGVIAASNRADHVDVWVVWVHVDVGYHKVERRPYSQHPIQICEVVLQV